MKKIGLIEDQLIQSVKRSKREFVERYSVEILKVEGEKVFQELYKNKNVETVSGEEADIFYKKLKDYSKKRDNKNSKLIEDYE